MCAIHRKQLTILPSLKVSSSPLKLNGWKMISNPFFWDPAQKPIWGSSFAGSWQFQGRVSRSHRIKVQIPVHSHLSPARMGLPRDQTPRFSDAMLLYLLCQFRVDPMILIQFTHIRITTLPPIVMAYFFAHEPIVKGSWILLEVEPSVWREKTITVVEI